MKIERFACNGVAGLSDREIDFAPFGTPLDLAVMTGPGGTGKSRTLFAMVHAKERLAPYGPGFPDDALIAKGGAAKIRIGWRVTEAEQEQLGLTKPSCSFEVLYPAPKGLPTLNDPSLVALLERYRHSRVYGKVDYLAPDRVKPMLSSASGDALSVQKRKRLALGSDKYASLKRMAVEAARQDDRSMRELRDVFAELCPSCRIGDVVGSDLELVRGAGASPLATASSSEWEAFCAAASIVLVGWSHSVVLYDTPELHLEDEEAARRVAVIRATSPTTQLIVATQSRAVAALAGKSLIRLGNGR